MKDLSKVQLIESKSHKPVGPKKSAVIEQRRRLLDWVKKTLPPISKIRQEIVHLWDDNYRIKYWGKNDAGEQVIKTSIFASITACGMNFKMKFRNEDEINWSLIVSSSI
ncbi:hypothetical protein LCGC14_0608590 [marine sediment metagenome]|uniref:Uncharacterized protein n=1 Tax=marine sediment metagenome TaxID=412755 RepID=A0A0F9TUP1_9ZZZZ